MDNTSVFIEGLIVKDKRQGAPDFVLNDISIKRLEMIEWLQTEGVKYDKDGWLNAQILRSRAGKPYVKVNIWKPKTQENQAPGVAKAQEDFDNITSPTADGGEGINPADLPF